MGGAVHKRVFERAVRIVGGRDKLARYLGSDRRQLSKWSTAARPPVYVLQALAHLLEQMLLKNHHANGSAAARDANLKKSTALRVSSARRSSRKAPRRS